MSQNVIGFRTTMTERCQNKFTQKLENQNLIFYVIIICSSLTVLYFYRLHVTTLVFSYGLGCLACYYGLNSSFLLKYISKLKDNFLPQTTDQEVEVKSTEEGCQTCGAKGCMRHDSRLMSEPWAGLQIHKQLDQAIEDFYNTILEQFINSWYSKITLQPFFVDELRNQLRYASAKLLKRALKVNYSKLITTRLVPCAMRHYCACTRDSCSPSPFSSPSPDSPQYPRLPPGVTPHPAACSRHHELQYLRCLTNVIMPYLVREQDQQNSVFRVLIREIFAGWVLLSLTDVLADPYILNTLIILATGDETMAQLPTTPNYKVEFLETFVRQTDSVYVQRSNLLNIDLEQVINDQEYFYSFMQYLKTTNHIHLLQFYKDIKSFQIRLLNPDLSLTEQSSLQREGRSLYIAYVRNDTVPLTERDRDELAELMDTDTVCINKLQTSRALYQAARQTHAILEKILLPRFLHSEEFYNVLIGSRIPTGYQKQINKKLQDRVMNTALRIGNRLKGALKNTTIDGQILDSCDGSDTDSDNIDILKYLDSIASDEEDLSTYKVVLTDVEIVACGRGSVRVFTVCVHGVGGTAGVGNAGGGPEGGARLWAVRRSENDFHLLRCKLHEFHQALNGLPLPSRRDNGPLENLRYKYEDFLQRLLRMELLQNSELLHLFLTVDGDFSIAVQASTMSGATTTDLANIYQNVAHRLRKEKGQHLESFLRNLLVSSDMERYQALKQGTTKDVEEAQEMSEDIEVEVVQKRQRQARDIRNSVFNDNLGVEPNVFEITASKYQDLVVGFTQCFMYLLSKVIRARSIVLAVVGTLLSLNRSFVDEMFDSFLNKTLGSLLSERRLAHLIRLGHGLLFSKKPSTPRNDSTIQRERARAQLLQCIPTSAAHVVGGGLQIAAATAFDIVQKPHLNKQLVYNLLDLCVAELFPELCEININEPKR